MLRAVALSLEQKRDKVYAAIRAKATDGIFVASCYITATFDDSVIVAKGEKLFRLAYTIDAKGNVTLGDETAVEISYTPVGEAISSGFLVGPVAGQEGTEPDGSAWHVVVIEAGMSKNRRRYGATVLEAAVDKYEGVQVYWNHRREGESPMRDPRDQAGIIEGVRGAVLEAAAKARTFAIVGTLKATDPELRTRLLEAHKAGTLSRQYGLSHDASIKGQIVREGANTFVDVLEIGAVESVDVVGKPAAGGRIMRAVAGLGQRDVTDQEIEMFAQTLEALKAKRPDLFAKLPANPTEADLQKVVTEAALEAVAPTPAPAPVPTPTPAPTATRTTESAQDPTMRELIVDRAFEGRTLPEKVKTRVAAELMARPGMLTIVEARGVIDAWVADLAPTRDAVGGGGLGTTVEHVIGGDACDRAVKGLDAFFVNKPVDGVVPFRSFREAYITVTGDRELTGNVRDAKNLKAFQRFFESRASEAMTSASWGEILGDSIRRAMLAHYRTASVWDAWRAIVSDITSPSDFRTNRRLRVAGYGDLATVAENGTYPALTSPTDEEATYTISKKGGIETITMEMIANDDVGAIRRIPVNLAMAAKRTLCKAVLNLLRDNSNIYTGTALALAGQSNISTTALSAAEISTARQKMAEFTAYGNTDEVLDISPKILLVPAELEELGWRLTSIPMHPESSKATTEPNYIRQRVGLDTLIVVPYWTDANNWWLVADPSTIPTIEVGFYQGRQEPDIFIADNPLVGSMFTADKIDYKVRFIFGVGVLDFRGFFGGIVA